MLHQHVLAGDAQICGAMFNIGWNIGGADNQQLKIRITRRHAQQAVNISSRPEAQLFQHGQTVFKDAAFGQGQGQRRHVVSINAKRVAILTAARCDDPNEGLSVRMLTRHKGADYFSCSHKKLYAIAPW